MSVPPVSAGNRSAGPFRSLRKSSLESDQTGGSPLSHPGQISVSVDDHRLWAEDGGGERREGDGSSGVSDEAGNGEEAGGVVEGCPMEDLQKARKRRREEGYWDERRKLRNKKKGDKYKANLKERKRKAWLDKEAALSGLPAEERQRLKEEEWSRKEATRVEQSRLVDEALKSGVRVVVDCGFAQNPSGKEMRSLTKQLERSMSVNRKADRPLALTFMSFKGALREHAAKAGAESWPVNRFEESALDVYDRSKIVVLSPDASEPLLTLQPDKVYLIGGLVDRTVRKNITRNYAEAEGLEVRRLPIAEYTSKIGTGLKKGMRGCHLILNVNSVVDALLEFHKTGDWGASLDAAIPKRKKRLYGGAPESSWDVGEENALAADGAAEGDS